MDKALSKVKGSLILAPDAGPGDRLKYQICAQFVIYLRNKDLSQKELAQELGLSEARMSEILHYRFKRFTVDNLLKYLTKIKPNVIIKIA